MFADKTDHLKCSIVQSHLEGKLSPHPKLGLVTSEDSRILVGKNGQRLKDLMPF